MIKHLPYNSIWQEFSVTQFCHCRWKSVMMGMQTENLLRCLVRYHGDQFLSNCQVMTSYMFFFSNVGTYESLKHLGLRSSVYLEKELAASIVCWLDMLSASNIINILLLQQITLLNFPGKSLLCMKNGCTWCISKLLTNWHVLYVSLKDLKGQRYSVNLEIEKWAEFFTGLSLLSKTHYHRLFRSLNTSLVCQMKTQGWPMWLRGQEKVWFLCWQNMTVNEYSVHCHFL